MAPSNNKYVHLPVCQVETIMKSSPEVRNISYDSIYLVARATELFIKFLAQESFILSENENKLLYRDVAKTVDQHQKLEFLRGKRNSGLDKRNWKGVRQQLLKQIVLSAELIPQKITVRKYKAMLKERNNGAKDYCKQQEFGKFCTFN